MWTIEAGGPSRDKYSCGRYLVERVKSLCINRGGYNAMDDIQFYRVRRSIVDECCHHSCDDTSVQTYCRFSRDQTTGDYDIDVVNGKTSSSAAAVATINGDEVGPFASRLYMPAPEVGTIPPEYFHTLVWYPRAKK